MSIRLWLTSKQTTINLFLLFTILAICSSLFVIVIKHLSPRGSSILEIETLRSKGEIQQILTQYSPGIYRPISDHRIGYLLQPNIERKAYNSIVRSDSLGLRSSNINNANDSKTRIVCLGDSVTFGFGVDQENCFPTVLEKLINTGSPEKVQVINSGMTAWNIQAESAWLSSNYSILKPDILIWQIHENDVVPIHGVAEGGHLISTFSPQFRDQGFSLISYHFDFSVPSTFLTSVIQNNFENILNTLSLPSFINTKVMFYLVFEHPESLSLFLENIDVDRFSYPVLLHPWKYLSYDYRLSWDPHFNNEGNRLIGHGIYQKLQSLGWIERNPTYIADTGFDYNETIGSLRLGYTSKHPTESSWKKVPSSIINGQTEVQKFCIGVSPEGLIAPTSHYLLRQESQNRKFLFFSGIIPDRTELLPQEVVLKKSNQIIGETVIVKSGQFRLELPISLTDDGQTNYEITVNLDKTILDEFGNRFGAIFDRISIE